MGASYNSELGHGEQYLKDCAKAISEYCEIVKICKDCVFYDFDETDCKMKVSVAEEWDI